MTHTSISGACKKPVTQHGPSLDTNRCAPFISVAISVIFTVLIMSCVELGAVICKPSCTCQEKSNCVLVLLVRLVYICSKSYNKQNKYLNSVNFLHFFSWVMESKVSANILISKVILLHHFKVLAI